MMLWFWLSANFLISRVIHIETTNEACRGEYAVSGMFLKGHTFKTITVDSPTTCQILCSQDFRCQSYNFIIGKRICELNNRTKEARPGDFVDDPWRFYMKLLGYLSKVTPKSFKSCPKVAHFTKNLLKSCFLSTQKNQFLQLMKANLCTSIRIIYFCIFLSTR